MSKSLQLSPLALQPLPLGTVRPLGWLKEQLRLQAEGLSGHLDEFWPDVKDSRWIGGGAEAWERFPYWLDGAIPLAYTLDDAPLKTKVAGHVDYILTHQDEDGWLGPREMIHYAGGRTMARYDLWAQFLALKALVQYFEATGDPRVPEAVEKNLRCIDYAIDRIPLFDWGKFRWFEALIPLYWLYERTQERWLLELAVKLQAQGFHWGDFFARWPLTQQTPRGRWNFAGHVVNNAMAVKAHGLWSRLSGERRDLRTVYEMITKLDRYHGMVTGVFTGDECLAGTSPTQGTELCAVVEYAYSLELLLAALADPAFGDRLEKIIFNALPATFSPDMWSHQYDQQVNQIECSARERPWVSNGIEANLFGLEPNYGCCTANLSQGWPKFAAHLWMGVPGGGLALAAYAPSRVETRVGDAAVRGVLETEYPFDETLHMTIEASKPAAFPLLLRIPAWSEGASIQCGHDPMIHPQPGSFYHLERTWQGSTELHLHFPMRPELWRGKAGGTALLRGPLVFALKIGERWQQVNQERPHRELPHADWEVYPTSPWNYALAVDEKTLAQDVHFERRALSRMPFSPDGAPLLARVKGRQLPGWQMQEGSAGALPPSPVESPAPLETLELIPYGCTNLRITEFPVLKK